jgi:FkbM family methyltransferase
MLIPLSYLPTKRIRGVIHIGAHHAEEANSYIRNGINDVIWIEANPSNIHIVNKQISSFPRMRAFCFAAGSKSHCLVSLNIANNGQSSSILDLGSHQTHHPEVKYINSIECQLLSIDDFVSARGIDLSHYNMMNLDIQGYELEALRGATDTLQMIDFIYTEVNSEEVYKKVPLFPEVESFLQSLGFSLVAKELTKYGWGDAFFARGNPAYWKLAIIMNRVKVKLKNLNQRRRFSLANNNNE